MNNDNTDFRTHGIIVPPGQKLFGFQVETVRKSLEFLWLNDSHAVYIGNQIGLGKSITAAITAQTLSKADPNVRILVLAPAVMCLVLQSEIIKWTGQSVNVISASKYAHLVGLSTYTIISYDLSWRDLVLEEIKKRQWFLLIADENHAVKGNSKRSKVFFKTIWPLCTYKILMSATPFSASVIDFFKPLNAILPTVFPSFIKFAERFSLSKYNPFTYNRKTYFGLKNAEDLKTIIYSNCFIRFKKEEVLKQLKPIQWSKVCLDSKYSVQADAETAKAAEQALATIETGAKPMLPSCLATHRRLQGIKKIPAILEFAKEILESGEPVIIYAFHREVVTTLREELKEYNPACIFGDTPAKERFEAVEKFQSGESKCFLANLISGGCGITLTKSHIVILAESSWLASDNLQACGRCHRISQDKQVLVYWLVVDQSLDERIAEVVMRRSKEFKEVTGDA